MDQAKQLFIPEKIKIGFQNRQDTYTQKLAYVIYYDKKGVLRKEKSWESWRDKKIKPNDYENVPTEGFVLNKGVGGARRSYGWNCRNEYIRVYDPRGFEFEISIANLLFILRECDCSRGKGLEGKFVYAWDGTELVLLPVESQEYKDSAKYTNLQDKKVNVKDLVPGCSYITRKQQELIYLGKFDYHFVIDSWRLKAKDKDGVLKRFVFWNGENFEYLDNIKNLAEQISDTPDGNYADLVEKYNKSAHGSKIVRLFLKEEKAKKIKRLNDDEYYRDDERWFVEHTPGVFTEYYTQFSGIKFYAVNRVGDYSYENGRFKFDSRYHTIYKDKNYWSKNEVWVEPNNFRLFAELENGVVIRVEDSNFKKDR